MHSESRNVFSVASMCPDYAYLLGALVLCCVADNELNPFHVLQMLACVCACEDWFNKHSWLNACTHAHKKKKKNRIRKLMT